jgi:hypothetical protein
MIMILTKRLFVVATIIATTVASASASASASKCEEQTTCSKCFNINPELNCTWVLLSDQGGDSSGSCTDADNDLIDQCGNNNNEIMLLSAYDCATGIDAKRRNGMKQKKWKRKNNKICKKLKDLISISLPCSDHSGDCNGCLSNNQCFWASFTDNCADSCPRTESPNDDDDGCYQGFPTAGVNAGKGTKMKKKKWKRKNKKICNKLIKNDVVIDDADDTDLDEQNSKLCQSKSPTNCEECIRTNLLIPLHNNNDNNNLLLPACQWFPTYDEDVITIGGSDGYCDSKCNKDGDCGVTMSCKAKPTLPKLGTTFPEYGPKGGLNGNEVKEKLLVLYPGLSIYIIEDGSLVTEDILRNRVRIFVESNDINVKEDEDDLGGRPVSDIPQVG